MAVVTKERELDIFKRVIAKARQSKAVESRNAVMVFVSLLASDDPVIVETFGLLLAEHLKDLIEITIEICNE